MPRVSVVLNSYNQAKYLLDAVESVLGQTYQDFELIIIDNGSTDDSPALLERYRAHPKVRLMFHRDNRAISRRFNEGVAAANGEFISFLYSDDFYLPGKLERQLACFEGLGPDYGIVYGPANAKNEFTGQRWQRQSMAFSGHIFKEMCLSYGLGTINMVSPLTRRECFRKYRFHEDIFAEGEYIFIRLALAYKFQYQPEPLVVLRDHDRNAGKAVKLNVEMFLVCMERIEQSPGLPREYLGYTRAYKAAMLRDTGWSLLRVNGSANSARECFGRAIRILPREAVHPRVLGGLGLSFLPAAWRGWLNRLADRARRVRVVSVYVEGYH